MDTQGMEGAILLPTLGVGMEQALAHDLPALTAAFRAFNRWLEEDWGFAYQNRIFAAPYITWPTPTTRSASWSGPWSGHPLRRHGRRPGQPPPSACAPRRRDVRPVLAAGQRLRHHRLLPRRRDRYTKYLKRLGRE
jgi:hypothetical protein